MYREDQYGICPKCRLRPVYWSFLMYVQPKNAYVMGLTNRRLEKSTNLFNRHLIKGKIDMKDIVIIDTRISVKCRKTAAAWVGAYFLVLLMKQHITGERINFLTVKAKISPFMVRAACHILHEYGIRLISIEPTALEAPNHESPIDHVSKERGKGDFRAFSYWTKTQIHSYVGINFGNHPGTTYAKHHKKGHDLTTFRHMFRVRLQIWV